MTPMFDPEPFLFGVPARFLLLGIGGVGAVIGMLLMRRAAGVEPAARAFRANAAPPVDRLAIVGLAAIGLLVAFVAYLALSR